MYTTLVIVGLVTILAVVIALVRSDESEHGGEKVHISGAKPSAIHHDSPRYIRYRQPKRQLVAETIFE